MAIRKEPIARSETSNSDGGRDWSPAATWALRIVVLFALGTSCSWAQIVTTVAGSAWVPPKTGSVAANAPLGQVTGVATDAKGNVFAADSGNDIVVRIAADGILTVVAGNGVNGYSGDGGTATNAMLSIPIGLALDAAGNIYIADSGNNRIRKVTSNGLISTVAGTGFGGFSGDGGLSTNAALNNPRGVALDATGNLFIADQQNHRIRKVTQSGLINTVAGTGANTFAGDGGPATAASLDSPSGVAIDTAGNLYIADTFNGRVRKVVNGIMSTVAGGATLIASPSSVAVDATGNLYFATYDGRVYKVAVNGTVTTAAGNGSGSFSGDGGPAMLASLNFPLGVALDGNGNLYIADTNNYRVRKVSGSGTIATSAGNGIYRFGGDGGPATSAVLNFPGGLCLDGAGTVYIADSYNNRIRRVAANGIINSVAGNGAGNASGAFSGDGGPATSAGLNDPQACAVDTGGNLYIADWSNNRIRKVTPDGTISTFAGNGSADFSGDGGPAALAALDSPGGVSVDAAGNVYIADSYNSRIRKVAPSGIINTVAGNGTASFSGDGGPALTAGLNSPSGAVADGAGNLYIADAGNYRIRKISSNGIISSVAGNGTKGYFGDGGPAASAAFGYIGDIRLDLAGNLFIADNENNRVRKLASNGTISTVAGNGTSGFSGDSGPATGAAFSQPAGVAVDSTGNLYIADWGNGRIRKLTLNATATTTTALTSSANPSTLGQPVTLTATVSPATATGMVTFNDGPSTLGIASLNNGTATFMTSTLAAGSHSLTAVYSGDGNNPGSTSAAINQIVNAVVTITTASPLPAGAIGVAYSVQLIASGGTLPYVWSVTSGNLPAGLNVSTSGLITGSPTTTGASVFGVTAKDSAGIVSQPQNLSITVNSPSNTTLTSSPNPSAFGQSVTLTATVSPASATGGVTFKDGSNTLGSFTLSGGTASLTLSTLTAGTHALTAVYSGDASNGGSTSSIVNQMVGQTATTTTLISSTNPSVFGQSVTLTATVAQGSGAPPGSGIVTFKDDSNTLGTGTLSNGTATLTLTTLSTGAHTLVAIYGGDANYAGSTSATLQQTVNGIISVTACSPNFAYRTSEVLPPPVTCQFSAILSAPFVVNTTASWLQVSPTSGTLGPSPALFSISVNPPGLSAGAPYAATFTISGPQLGSLTVPVQLTVSQGTAPTLVATPTALSFDYLIGSIAPATQALTISSTNGTQLPFTVTPNGGTWLVPLVINATCPAQFNVFVIPIGLSPNTYKGTLTIASPGVPSIVVNVSLTVTAPVPPQLSVNTQRLSLSGLQGAAPATDKIEIANTGGGVLNFTAATSGGDWLSLSQTSGAIDSTASSSSVVITVSGDPSSLNPGTYQGAVIITGAGSTVTVPVAFSVIAPKPKILVSQSGLGFTAVAQGGAPLPQQVGILNIGDSTLTWAATASTLSGGNWLQISSAGGAAGGTVQQPYLDVSLADVTIDPTVVANLSPGDYYGQIQVSGQAVNSPQLVTVILTVLAPGLDPGPEVRPSSLIFTGLPGVSPNPQSVTIGIRKGEADQYLSSHIGSDYTYSPDKSTVQPNQPANLNVIPDFTALAPSEIDRGSITLQFSDGTIRNVALLTVVAPSPSGNSKSGLQASSSCGVLNLQWRTPAPPSFSVVQGRAKTLELQVVDSCGNLIGPADPTTAAVHVTFSNKDADLPLVHVGNGVWTGTWKPVNSSAGPVAVSVTAFNSLKSGPPQSGQSTTLFGTILPGNTPLVTAGGVQHAASYVLGAPIAPGTLITLKGLNLADTNSTSSDQPLPTVLNGTQVFLGTEAMPLLYASDGQVKVQVPYDAPVNTQFQVTVQRDNVQSLPEQLVIAPAQPGIFTVDSSGAGQGVIYRSDGLTFAQPGSAATAGETISIYCTGLGTVTPPVPAGTPPPDSLSTTDNAVAVTIGGQDGQATVGTLVQGQPGVYRIVATVPAGVLGDALPVVVTVAGQSSPAVVTMAVQ